MLTEAELKLKACRFDYEYMGKSIEALALSYNYPEALLANEITMQCWQRKCQVETLLPTTADIKDYAVALADQTRQKLSVIALFRQIENLPLMAQLENACLAKAMDIINSIDPEDSSSSARLSNLVKAIQMLQESNPISVADRTAEDVFTDSGVTVNILNQIQ